MALIKCPECGQEVSDRAQFCPKCAFPLSELRTDGDVSIKMTPISQTINARQKVSVIVNGRTIWEGQTGQIADIHFDGPTTITIKYHTNLTAYGAECTGVIEPQKGKKYAVQRVRGAFKAGMSLQRVDVIDAD